MSVIWSISFNWNLKRKTQQQYNFHNFIIMFLEINANVPLFLGLSWPNYQNIKSIRIDINWFKANHLLRTDRIWMHESIPKCGESFWHSFSYHHCTEADKTIGIRGTAELIANSSVPFFLNNYLGGESHQVKLNLKTFIVNKKSLFSGVLQGNILGPSLFLVYLNDLICFSPCQRYLTMCWI